MVARTSLQRCSGETKAHQIPRANVMAETMVMSSNGAPKEAAKAPLHAAARARVRLLRWRAIDVSTLYRQMTPEAPMGSETKPRATSSSMKAHIETGE